MVKTRDKFHIPSHLVVESFSRSMKATGGEDLQVEEPVSCRDCASFDFHPVLPSMLGATLIRHEVVQVSQAP